MIYEKLRDLLISAGLQEYAITSENTGGLPEMMLLAACGHLEKMYAISDGVAWDISVDVSSMKVTAEETLGFVASDVMDDSLRQLTLLADSVTFASEMIDGKHYVKVTVRFGIELI